MSGFHRHDPSSRKPVFFLSYAHAPRVPGNEESDPDASVRRLFFDLSDHVNQLVSKDTGIQVGAMDRTMGGNERWSRKLLRDLGTCHVFVALTSWPYFDSKWCGMEWGVFESRAAQMEAALEAAEEHEQPVDTALLPVRWVKTERNRTPKVNQAIQEFAPASGGREESLYKTHGLYGLSQGGRHRDVYDSVVWDLAQRIAQIYYEVALPDLVHDSHESLPNVFSKETS